MKTKKLMLLTVAMLVVSSQAIGQTATQIQQQKTEAAVAGQAAKTNAAAQDQANKTQAATADQAARTQAASQQQAQQTQTASEKQRQETEAAVRRQGGTPELYVNQPVSGGGAVVYGLAPAVSAASSAAAAPQIYNSNNSLPGSMANSDNAGEKQLQDEFREIDTNHDGFISKTEFSIYYKTTADDTRFDSYDINRDMMLSYFEFRGPNASGGNITIPAH